VDGACAGNHDTKLGAACKADDWCAYESFHSPEDYKCCPLQADGKLVCTDVYFSRICRTKKLGEPCNQGYECYSDQCTGSEFQIGVCY
jgi:hypothetical protein